MSKSRSSIYNTMRGGQIVFHYIRMAAQVLKKNLFFFLLSVCFIACLTVYFLVDRQIVERGTKYLVAIVKTEYLLGGDDKTTVVMDDGREILTTWRRIYSNKAMENNYQKMKNHLLISFYGSFIFAVVAVIGWFAYLGRRGKAEAEDEFIRGGRLGTLSSHEKAIRLAEKDEGSKSVFKIAGVRLPPKSELYNIALIGSPGVGKSVTIMELMVQMRALGHKNFVLDPGGQFTRKLYRPGVDIILSPRDKRSHYWDVWSEGINPESYHITAQSLISESGNESGKDFFALAARFVFEAVCERVYNSSIHNGSKPTLQQLTNYILRVDDETLIDIVKHSDAKSVLNDKSEKTSASIRATLSTFLQPLAKLPKEGSPFSFKRWIEENDDSWVFVPLLPKHRDYYRPVLTMWMEHFTMGVLSRDPENEDNRFMNLIGDELTSYNKIPSLFTFLAESRKYRGNGVFGFQNRSQLEMIYGTKGATALQGFFGTYCVFRTNSTDDSKWGSEILLSAEVEKSAESLSMGAHDVRDSVSLNKTTKEVKLVMSSEIVNLKDLEFFARFGKGFDVLRLKQKYVKYPDIADAIISITDEELAEKSYSNHLLGLQKDKEEAAAKAEKEAKKREEERAKKAQESGDSYESDDSPSVPPNDSSGIPADYEDYANNASFAGDHVDPDDYFASRINISSDKNGGSQTPEAPQPSEQVGTTSAKKPENAAPKTDDLFTRGF